MYSLISILIVLASIALILVVLVQKSKGSGLASGFSSSNQIMGVRKTTDFIEKATWGLAIFIAVLSLSSAAFLKQARSETPKTMIEAPNLPTSTTPADVNTTLPMPAAAQDQPQTEEAKN